MKMNYLRVDIGQLPTRDVTTVAGVTAGVGERIPPRRKCRTRWCPQPQTRDRRAH